MDLQIQVLVHDKGVEVQVLSSALVFTGFSKSRFFLHALRRAHVGNVAASLIDVVCQQSVSGLQ
ncbi:hypothetical protein CKO51_27915 [Rhodopirellula sp. SM50]|nr:hypothetical protein CKO51_27915 [Rhodopirellula sp. SM50]